ncbi:poly(3-hydroxyalkanoate) synthetase [Pseudochelatococcus lubricantis]|uniref:Poly(3-hydroxyalkanoate) synthetase n=1 Tax=Pseudochelatococcus lubricantis TaxID=1538102 RepID=A0ABX0V018_9HYPH|nr:poly(3-hydroxyalkanoate) synthetase [Pseudochelatococcus lubricantis]
MTDALYRDDMGGGTPVNATRHHSGPTEDDARSKAAAPTFTPFRLPLIWTALAMDASGRMATAMAKSLSELAAVEAEKSACILPDWTTDHKVALELEAVTLREFARGERRGPATLICTPLAFVRALIADFAPGHSVVASLLDAGLSDTFVIDWRSATDEMRNKSLDSYFSDLNVVVDHLDPPVHLIGLCQGGWMALAYAARFPEKVDKLVLVGAPVDMSAQTTRLTTLSAGIPLAVVERLVALDRGIVEGARFLKFWAPAGINDEYAAMSLQLGADASPAQRAALVERFTHWFGATINLPGRYFLDVVGRLLQNNGLVSGDFQVLGVPIDLKRVRSPVTLIAAEQDEVVGSEQLFAAERFIGTAKADIRKIIVPGNHLGLFVGADVNRDIWPGVGQWLADN